MSLPLNRYSHIVADPYEVDVALADVFGLTRAVFERAVLAGDLERRRTVSDDAPGAPGYYAYNGTLRSLRRESRRQGGWHPGLFRAIPVSYDSSENLAITVSSADERTGRIGEDPSTKNIKGGDAAAAIDGNQLALDDYRPFDEPVDFFYLLFSSDDEGVFAEVSMPTFQDESGRITGWSPRFILGRIGGDDSKPSARRTDLAPTGDVDVIVERKAS